MYAVGLSQLVSPEPEARVRPTSRAIKRNHLRPPSAQPSIRAVYPHSNVAGTPRALHSLASASRNTPCHLRTNGGAQHSHRSWPAASLSSRADRGVKHEPDDLITFTFLLLTALHVRLPGQLLACSQRSRSFEAGKERAMVCAWSGA